MLKDILYRQFADIRKEEWPRALLLSAFFFLVIATYWILKPIKRGVIINFFSEDPLLLLGFAFSGAEAEQFGKILNLIVAYDVVVLFTWLARRFPRHYLVLIFAALCSAAFAFYASVIGQLSEAVVWTFYVFGDMFNTVMVALFWAFTNDLVTSEEAKRTYGLIGLGGVIGGFFGATIVTYTVENFGRAPLLLFCILPMVLIVLIAFQVQRRDRRAEREKNGPAAPSRGRLVAWEGAKMVLASRYLLAITGIIALYEISSNIIDFQLAATVEAVIEEPLDKDDFFAHVGQIIGVASIVVQLFLTSYIMRRFGVGLALFFLPFSLLLTSMGFLLLPTLYLAASMSVSDNSLNYSINQSAKETLYTVTSKDVTYRAKAFIDIFVQRFAKVIAALLNLTFATLFVAGVRWLSLATAAAILAWFFLVRYVGRRFEELEETDGQLEVEEVEEPLEGKKIGKGEHIEEDPVDEEQRG